MNRRQSLDKGILSPPGPFLTPSPSPSIQHSPRLQPSPSQSPFQQDVLLVTNNNQHFINTYTTTQEQDRKGTPNRRLSINHINSNAGATLVYRPSPTQSPAGSSSSSSGGIGNEYNINTTLIGSNNISLNKKGKRTPQHGSTSNSCSPKASKKTMALMGSSPITSPIPSPTLNSQLIQQFPTMMNANNSILFMQQQPAQSSQRPSIIQTSNTHQSNYIVASSSSGSSSGGGTIKQNKAPQQILPKPAANTSLSSSSMHGGTQSIITSASSTKQIVTQSKMAIVQQQSNQTQHFQSPPHQSQQIMSHGSSSPSPQPQQVTQSGSIILPSGSQPLLLNQMPVLVQQNAPQGVQLIIRPQTPQLTAPSLVIHNRPQMQQPQPQQLLRILNANGSMQLATATTPTFIVSSQANIIQQNLQSMKTPTSGSATIGSIQQQNRQPQQLINIGQSMAQIQNLQLNGNLTQIQMPNGLNGQFIQQLPAQFQQNIGGFNQIQPITAIATNATFQSPPQGSNTSQNEIVPNVVSTSQANQIQFTTNQQSTITMSPVATSQSQLIQSEPPILSSPPSGITFNSQPQTVIVTGDKQLHEISSPPPSGNYSIIHQQPSGEMINIDMSHHHHHQQHHQQQHQTNVKPPRKPKKSKKKQAMELAAQQAAEYQAQQQQQQQQIQQSEAQVMMSPTRNSQAPTGKLDLANVMKLCGIMEDDDFMDSDEPMMEQMEQQPSEHTQTIHIPASSGNENQDIMITIPGAGGSSDQPFTFTIPSSSLENATSAEGSIIHSGDGKVGENIPFMIRFDSGEAQNGGQPYTISIPNLTEDGTVIEEGRNTEIITSTTAPTSMGSMCVPTFVNSVLNSSVTPTIQSQINEIQNQLMAMPPASTASTKPTKAPRQKKQATKKSKKQLEKTIEAITTTNAQVPTQIGNIQISQIDSTSMKNNNLGNKNINNQIQIMPILEKSQSCGGQNNSGQMIDKQRMQVPIMQQSVSHQNNQQQNNNHNSGGHQQHHHHQQGSTSNNSGPSQVNINVQQNQLINVTNNLQMQVIANPQQQQQHHHNSGAQPAPAPPSSNAHQSQSQNSVVTSQPTLNAQNLIGNIINAQQGQPTGNIIIQGGHFNHQQQQSMPANIQVNIQNQTIANNIITTAAPVHQQNVQSNNQNQQPTAQSILSQLTGNLVLALSDDGRLILRHDPNIPQDAQSQVILQTILTGALGNVSLINEPLKTPQQNQQNNQQQQQQHVISSNGKIQQVTTVQNKNVIITSQAQQMQQPQQIYTNVVQSQPMPGHIITQNASQQMQMQQSKMESGTNNQQQQQTVVLPNPNILKFVELPKIQPNQQLFSLNTITNEITQLNPNQTTAALSPMERLLIVPSGINAQQLAQCLSQGQIHFNNIGQAPTSDPNKVQMQLHQQQIQLQQQQQMSYKTQPIVQKVNPIVKKEPIETKPKKVRGKKAKLLEEQQKLIKKEPIVVQAPAPKMIMQMSNVDTKMIKTTTITTSTVTTMVNSSAKSTITISPNPSLIVNQSKSSKNVQNFNNIQKATANMKSNPISVMPSQPTLITTKPNAVKAAKNNQIKSAGTPQLSPIISQQAVPPPLVSVNQAPIPRVQTIQLTPQKQQSLKNVQMQIQQLSAKLQNKNLLATLTADVDPTNPVHNNPLPILTNIDAMTDSEIYNALQRLFVEQQKILATGKIIPTIPAAAAAAVSPHTMSSNQQSGRNLQNSGMQPQPIFASNSSIVSPISASTSVSTLYGGGNSQTIPSPIQVNSPIVKQEAPCSASTSSSQPPPLVVSTPIQMQIKTEILLSPTSIPQTVTAPGPLATGSIVISPKYTTAPGKIQNEPVKEPKIIVDSKKDIVVLPPPPPEIDHAAILKQQQQQAAIEANRKMKITRSSLFERQICVDQEGCQRPDVKVDFASKEDAVKRLIRYHCYYDEVRNEHDPKEEFEFEEQAKMFLASYKEMQKKYQNLLLKQSQQFAPTSELMMLDRLQVADLKDEIVAMQMEINSALYEQHQESLATIKTEPQCVVQQQSPAPQLIPRVIKTEPIANCPPMQYIQNPPIVQSTQILSQPIVTPAQQGPSRNLVASMQEPSQIIKAKQEQKLFESIKNERLKVEPVEPPKEIPKPITFAQQQQIVNPIRATPSPKSPSGHHKQSKFDKLKNESLSMSVNHQQMPQLVQRQQQSPNLPKSVPCQQKPIEMKEELDDFDIESEIRPNLIMKKCEPTPPLSIPSPSTVGNKKHKQKEREREFSPLSEIFNTKIESHKNKSDVTKSDSHDGAYDEWLSIQKELNLQLTSSAASSSKKKDGVPKKNDLSDIFEHHASPKSVEKQLDDLFSSTSKSNDLMTSQSPLNELFRVDGTNSGTEKTVENRLEALFGEDDSVKSNQQDLVETRLEQLFQGSVSENDESALDNASFLYKSTEMAYEMIQHQMQATSSSNDVSNVNSGANNKRQWSSTSCDMFPANNSSMMFQNAPSPSASKRACTTASSVSFDNKWIEDGFDFGQDIIQSESSGEDVTKHRSWNGNVNQPTREAMIGGISSPHQNQFHMPSATDNINSMHQNHNLQQNSSHMNINSVMDHQQDQLMDTQMAVMNYDDPDDISRQVQNAIDSILNLQSSDPLHYQLDSSFLELNTLTAPTAQMSPSLNQSSQQSHQIPNHHQHHNQYSMDHHQPVPHQTQFTNHQKSTSSMPKRKYSQINDIGDCLIGGSNLEDSPSALTLTSDSHSEGVGEFVNNLLSCDEKSITS